MVGLTPATTHLMWMKLINIYRLIVWRTTLTNAVGHWPPGSGDEGRHKCADNPSLRSVWVTFRREKINGTSSVRSTPSCRAHLKKERGYWVVCILLVLREQRWKRHPNCGHLMRHSHLSDLCARMRSSRTRHSVRHSHRSMWCTEHDLMRVENPQSFITIFVFRPFLFSPDLALASKWYMRCVREMNTQWGSVCHICRNWNVNKMFTSQETHSSGMCVKDLCWNPFEIHVCLQLIVVCSYPNRQWHKDFQTQGFTPSFRRRGSSTTNMTMPFWI